MPVALATARTFTGMAAGTAVFSACPQAPTASAAARIRDGLKPNHEIMSRLPGRSSSASNVACAVHDPCHSRFRVRIRSETRPALRDTPAVGTPNDWLWIARVGGGAPNGPRTPLDWGPP